MIAYLFYFWFLAQIFATDDDFKDNVTFGLMFHLGIADLCQLLPQIAAGLMTVFQTTINETFNRVW